MKVMNYLYNVARKDGTFIGTFARGMVFEPLLGHAKGTAFDATKFNWIGSISNEVSVCAFWHTSAVKNWEDMKTKPHKIGGSAAGADSDVFPTVLRKVYNLPMKLVTGYARRRRRHQSRHGARRSGRPLRLVVRSMLSQSKALVDGKKINIVMQLALEKHEDLPNVPLIMDLPASPQDKAAIRADHRRARRSRGRSRHRRAFRPSG